jgi:hypothetical protein
MDLPAKDAISILQAILHRWQQEEIIYGNKKRSAQIATKTTKYSVKPQLLACNAQHDITGKRRHSPQDVIFDSDSFLIQIDSNASRSISNDKSHFESIEYLDANDPAGILGPTGERSPIKGKGTIKWKIEDDNGVVHTIKLKNALYVPAFKTCLLCTQH